eukprot:gene3492-biopygen11680
MLGGWALKRRDRPRVLGGWHVLLRVERIDEGRAALPRPPTEGALPAAGVGNVDSKTVKAGIPTTLRARHVLNVCRAALRRNARPLRGLPGVRGGSGAVRGGTSGRMFSVKTSGGRVQLPGSDVPVFPHKHPPAPSEAQRRRPRSMGTLPSRAFPVPSGTGPPCLARTPAPGARRDPPLPPPPAIPPRPELAGIHAGEFSPLRQPLTRREPPPNLEMPNGDRHDARAPSSSDRPRACAPRDAAAARPSAAATEYRTVQAIPAAAPIFPSVPLGIPSFPKVPFGAAAQFPQGSFSHSPDGQPSADCSVPLSMFSPRCTTASPLFFKRRARRRGLPSFPTSAAPPPAAMGYSRSRSRGRGDDRDRRGGDSRYEPYLRRVCRSGVLAPVASAAAARVLAPVASAAAAGVLAPVASAAAAGVLASVAPVALVSAAAAAAGASASPVSGQQTLPAPQHAVSFRGSQGRGRRSRGDGRRGQYQASLRNPLTALGKCSPILIKD